ncbi:unnamed protein product [Tilletia controversa]|uniref:Uncharacterized protein n=3 Tax=Tilletia TaxID=13289 RepID=A0A8X7MTN3_9BASI|nr:hypothetical protein CF336_g3817 [Tilletia laevis]KAE8195255.1 hypothetical protein CF328_g4494 [Tilletia controversa]KAE8261188.1 hypothetical protein A4X03_0g3470 [Tilletia caries]KAE8203508.1 hypothetical protein CF335_g2988 [Tilletia laevis]KAE8247377.1 hypothetical protein A4X06_0g4500 [Tilletia controversa]
MATQHQAQGPTPSSQPAAEINTATGLTGSTHPHPPSGSNSVSDGKQDYAISDHDIEQVGATEKEGQHAGLPPAHQQEEEPSRMKLLLHSKGALVARDFGLILLILGWWIPSVANTATRHKWIPNTIIGWFFILLILFHNSRYIPQRPFVRAFSSTFNTVLGKPWSMLPYYGKVAFGWCSILVIFFGSAYGIKQTADSRYADRTRALFGIFLIYGSFYVFSSHRKSVKLQPLIVGVGMQMVIALLVFKTKAFFDLFQWFSFAAADLISQGYKGAAFFWGQDIVFEQHLFIAATLGGIIFFIALCVALFYLGVLTWVIRKFAFFFFRTMGISGAEAVVAAASPFIGQGENAVLVQPYLPLMTRSELHQVLTSGFATVAGSVFLAYVSMGINPTLLITSCVMSIPASIAASKTIMPETEEPLTMGRIVVDRGEEDKDKAVDVLHAFSNGAWLGVRVAALIFCNVLVIISLVGAINGILTYIGKSWGLHDDYALTLELILGYFFYPFCWCLGVPKQDLITVARLLGTKIIQNEFVAYGTLGKLTDDQITPRARTIATFVLCGFGNLGSLGINIGVLSALAPGRGGDIAKLAPRALITGILVTCSSAAIAGILG